MCRLCNFITSSVNDIMSHILIAHNIDLNDSNHTNLEEFILSKFRFML